MRTLRAVAVQICLASLAWALLVAGANAQAPSAPSTEFDPFSLPTATLAEPVEPAPEISAAESAETPTDESAAEDAAEAPEEEAPEVSVAEQITRLEETIQEDEARIVELRREISDPMSEYRLAEMAYKEALAELEQAQQELANLPPGEPDEAAKELVETLQKKSDLARDSFDLAIETRKTLQEQIAALEDKQKQDRAALGKLTGDAPASVEESTEPVAPTSEATPAASPGETPPVTPEKAAEPEPPVSKELREAESEAKETKDEAEAAEQEAQSVSDRIAALDRDIALENKLLKGARKKADLAYQTAQNVEAEKEALRTSGAAEEALRQIREDRRAAESQCQHAREEVAERVDRLNDLQSQRADLQRDELAALAASQAKQEEAERAEAHVAELKNPFSIANLLAWSVDHGVKVLAIVLLMLALRFTVTLTSQRIVKLMIMRTARGTHREREDRAQTLVGVFHNAASVAVVVGGALMVCEEVGIAVGPLMGGAAVLGLAIAFGAQNLLRDYFYGFVILLENQYKLSDVLRIGDISGQVEQITLRMTVLRDQEGNVHFIPNGKIDSVTNMTHGWSRAAIEVGVGYGEDTERVMRVLFDVANETRRDPKFSALVIDEPEMLGVERLDVSAVTLKFLVKTTAGGQDTVKRDLLRRIKLRFDELGIEFPGPQRAKHSRPEAGDVTRMIEPPRRNAA